MRTHIAALLGAAALALGGCGGQGRPPEAERLHGTYVGHKDSEYSTINKIEQTLCFDGPVAWCQRKVLDRETSEVKSVGDKTTFGYRVDGDALVSPVDGAAMFRVSADRRTLTGLSEGIVYHLTP